MNKRTRQRKRQIEEERERKRDRGRKKDRKLDRSLNIKQSYANRDDGTRLTLNSISLARKKALASSSPV